MSGVMQWFSIMSKEQREQHQEDYFKRMFPLGEAQRISEQKLLEQCILTEIPPNEKLYQLQIVKEALMQSDEKRKRAKLRKWYGAPLVKKLPHQERAMLLALAELEQECSSVEEMPTPEEIRRRSEILDMKLLQKKKFWC